MAQNIITNIVDDFDGTTPAETYTFEFDGKHYEIDMSPLNVANFDRMVEAHHRKIEEQEKKFAEKMERYLAVARPVAQAKSSGKYMSNPDAPKIREWAKSNGIDVPAKGRLKKDLVAAYKKAKKNG